MKKQIIALLLMGVAPMQANMTLVKEGCQKSVQSIAQLLQGLGSVTKGSALMAANVVRKNKKGSLITATGLGGIFVFGSICWGLSHCFESDAFCGNQFIRGGAWLARGPWEGAKIFGKGVYEVFVQPFVDWRVGSWLRTADSRFDDLEEAAYEKNDDDETIFNTTNTSALVYLDQNAIDALAREINFFSWVYYGDNYVDWVGGRNKLRTLQNDFKCALDRACDDVTAMRVNKFRAGTDITHLLDAANISESNRQGYINILVEQPRSNN